MLHEYRLEVVERVLLGLGVVGRDERLERLDGVASPPLVLARVLFAQVVVVAGFGEHGDVLLPALADVDLARSRLVLGRDLGVVKPFVAIERVADQNAQFAGQPIVEFAVVGDTARPEGAGRAAFIHGCLP